MVQGSHIQLEKWEEDGRRSCQELEAIRDAWSGDKGIFLAGGFNGSQTGGQSGRGTLISVMLAPLKGARWTGWCLAASASLLSWRHSASPR